jgi:hypothetical protein
MEQGLEFAELEQVYDLMARALDSVGAENEALFLSKLSIVLAHRLGDLEAVREAVEIAARELPEH